MTKNATKRHQFKFTITKKVDFCYMLRWLGAAGLLKSTVRWITVTTIRDCAIQQGTLLIMETLN